MHIWQKSCLLRYIKGKLSCKDDMASWVNQHRIPHCAVDDLLKLLKKNCLAEPPSTAKTLQKAPKSIEVTVKSNMQYIHFTLHHVAMDELKIQYI